MTRSRKSAVRFPGRYPGIKRAEVFQIVCHVLGIKRDCRPEIAEEIDQNDVQHIVEVRLTAGE